jgi:hypothetical protein
MGKKKRTKHRSSSKRVSSTSEAGTQTGSIGREYLASQQSKLNLPISPLAKRLSSTINSIISDVPDEQSRDWLRAWANALERMANTVPGLPDQDAGTYGIVADLLHRVDRSCRKAGITPLEGTVVGTLKEKGVNAFNASFFGTTSLIVVHEETLIFVLLLAKCLVPTFTVVSQSKGISFGAVPPEGQFTEAVKRLRELITAMKEHRSPSRAPKYVPPPSWPLHPIVWKLIRAIELFILSHEYGHLVIDRGDGSFLPEAFRPTSSVDSEYHADIFAYMILVADSDEKSFFFVCFAPMMLFKFLALMESKGYSSEPEEHPQSEKRLKNLLDVYYLLTENADPRFKELLSVWNSIERQIDRAWISAIESLQST